MDRLWSPWRLDYITAPKPKTGCVFCDAATASTHVVDKAGTVAGDFDQASLIVWAGQLAYVILNRYPYNNGHLMVVPHRHTSTLTALAPEELHEIILLVQRSERALREAYRLEGLNIGLNLGKAGGAGIEDHLHVHLVPRWSGDTNFMTVIGETRVLPQDLPTTAKLLRPIFARLATEGESWKLETEK
jgi:ATP adenylyltransferase